jgi:hypothetical protein
MVKVWKIGQWPGIWGGRTKKHKERYVKEYALPFGFVAVGYGWIPNIRTLDENTLRKEVAKDGSFVGRRTKELLNFAYHIKEDDIILLYSQYHAYVGVATKKNNEPYYFVKKGSCEDYIKDAEDEDIAPHRIKVKWLYKKPFGMDFSMWRDTVHEVTLRDLSKIEDDKLRNLLLQKIKKSAP